MRRRKDVLNLLTVHEAAAQLHCTRFMVHYLVQHGFLQAVRLPAGQRPRVLIYREAVERVAERMKEEDWYPNMLKDARRKMRAAKK